MQIKAKNLRLVDLLILPPFFQKKSSMHEMTGRRSVFASNDGQTAQAATAQIANYLPIGPVGTPPAPHPSVAHGIGSPRPGFGERYLFGSARTRAGKGAVPPRLKTGVWRCCARDAMMMKTKSAERLLTGGG